MILKCAAGHDWERPAQRGRPPHWCPEHAPGRPEGYRTPQIKGQQQLAVTNGSMQLVDEMKLEPAKDPRELDPGARLTTLAGKPAVKMRIPAAEVRPGDFTTFSGFRRVVSTRAASIGLCATGSKVYGKRMAFLRSGGTETDGTVKQIVERVAVTALLTVYREDVS